MAAAAYPARLGLEAPETVARWRPFVHWLLAIPQFFVAEVMSSLRAVLSLIALFTVLFTKRIPSSIFDAIVMTHRYEWRVYSYAVWMREGYPPFSFATVAQDDGIDAATVSIDRPEQLNRWLPLVKWFLAIPHYVVLAFLFVAAFVVILFSLFAVLFTGRYPAGMRSFVVGVARWAFRVQTYVLFLTDEYPPFSLE